MKDGLLERIEGVGHWRLVLRPLAPLPDPLSFHACRGLVPRARVSIRGWDLPHIGRREDDQGGSERGEDYYENWCDWHTQVEFWRMFRSGQFVSYNALDDDLERRAGDDVRRLNVVGAIYSVTEFVEFAHRLAEVGPYRSGYGLDLSLRNTRGRYLEAGRGRMPFLDFHRVGGENVRIDRRVEPAAIAEGAIATSLSVLLELFDVFGWNPSRNQIRSDQEKFYRRDFF